MIVTKQVENYKITKVENKQILIAKWVVHSKVQHD
jgi:hypothetical protein